MLRYARPVKAPSAVVVACFVVAAVVGVFASGAARADDLSKMLEKGPMARVDVDKQGKFDAVVSVVDVDTPAARLWGVLTDYPSYRFFMPRVEQVGVATGPDGIPIVTWNIDTPLVATKYENAMTVDDAKMVLLARTVKGDMSGSRYEWRVQSLGDNKCRMIHTAWPRNMASIVDTLDDKQQTLTIGVAVSSVMATVRALKIRAESLERAAVARDATTAPATSTP